MSVLQRLRAYHALLATLVVFSYLSGEWGIVHAWLGYGVSGVILLRLVMAFTGAPQLGLMRFYPHFSGLKLDNALTHPAISRTLLLAIAVCLVVATSTGIALDKGRAIGVAQPQTLTSAYADDDEIGAGNAQEEDEEFVEEAHELFANALMLFVILHIIYLFLFKRPLAQFMLFMDKGNKNEH